MNWELIENIMTVILVGLFYYEWRVASKMEAKVKRQAKRIEQMEGLLNDSLREIIRARELIRKLEIKKQKQFTDEPSAAK